MPLLLQLGVRGGETDHGLERTGRDGEGLASSSLRKQKRAVILMLDSGVSGLGMKLEMRVSAAPSCVIGQTGHGLERRVRYEEGLAGSGLKKQRRVSI